MISCFLSVSSKSQLSLCVDALGEVINLSGVFSNWGTNILSNLKSVFVGKGKDYDQNV